MPKLLSQSKHEVFESNSALQIRNQKERRGKENEAMQKILAGCEYFVAYEFAPCEIFKGCEIVFPVPLFILLLTF